MADIILSDKEKELLELIKTSEVKVTVKIIEEKLSKGHVGALGKLLGKELIESKKDRQGTNAGNYGLKMVKYYAIKEPSC